MNSEEIHLKSWSNKIQEKKMYKMFLRSQTFRSNITAFLWHYNIMTIEIFTQLCTIDQASFPYTMQWHRLHYIAKEASSHDYIVKKLEDIHSTQAVSFRISFIQVGVCSPIRCAWWKFYVNTLIHKLCNSVARISKQSI